MTGNVTYDNKNICTHTRTHTHMLPQHPLIQMVKIRNQYSVNKLSINKVNLMSFKVEGQLKKNIDGEENRICQANRPVGGVALHSGLFWQ